MKDKIKLMEKNLIKILFAISLILIINSSSIFADENEYIKEFSNEGESCSFDTINSLYYWDINGQERKITFYKCGELELPFDTENKYLLSEEQLKEIFQTRIIREHIRAGELTEDLYDPKFLNEGESIICDDIFGFPTIRDEGVNVAAGVYETKIARLLPKDSKVAIVVGSTIATGRELKLIKNVNYAALAVAVTCQATKFYDQLVIDYLATCKQYTHNLQEGVSYEGKIEDLKNCHNRIIKQLKNSRVVSAYMWFEAGETLAGNIYGKVKSWVKNETFEPDESLRQKALIEVIQLQSKTSILNDDTKSAISAKNAETRFEEKKKEAEDYHNNVKLVLADISSKTNACPKLLESTTIYNWFHNPNCELEDFKQQLKTIGNNINTIKSSLIDKHKYNTGINNLKGEENKFATVSKAIDEEVSRERKIDKFVIALIIILSFIFVSLTVTFQRSRR